jgi:putative ABC transport system ATP-binding protein
VTATLAGPSAWTAPATSPVIDLQGGRKTYTTGSITFEALRGVDVRIDRGEYVAIMGPSGSGKSTLMNVLGCLDVLTAGTYRLAGHDVGDLDEVELAQMRNEEIGVVFQQFHLLPYLTALENVMVAQHYHSVADAGEARAALDRVGLSDRAHHRPAELSGGEQQRVCVARALVNQPKLLLADEPTGNLDEANESKVLTLFEELHAEGHTLVTVTHALRVGLLADRRIELAHGRLVDLTVPSQEIERRYDEVLIQLWLADERRSPLAPERVQLPDVVDTRRTLKGMHESGLLASPQAPLAFTPRGKSRARDLIRRRRLAEVLFSSALHLPEDEVEQTACLMEHVIDPTVANSICAFLGHPRRCPHGRPIPTGDCCELPIVHG